MNNTMESPSSWVRFRQWFGGATIKSVLTGLAYCARVSPHYWKNRNFTVDKGLFYTTDGDPQRSLDIYTPEGEGPFPTVFFVHGGGFRICSKDTHWMMAHTLVRRGYVVVSINYRLVPHVRFPVPPMDVCDAFMWTVEQAEARGLDLSRLFLMGESAGANLVTMLALCLFSERPEPWAQQVRETGVRPVGLIPQCGMLEVSNVERYKDLPIPTWMADRIVRVARDYLGDAHGEEGALASPLCVIEKGQFNPRDFPPVFAPVGGADPILEDTTRLGEALEHHGVDSQAPVYEEAGHAFHAMGTSAARQCWRDTLAFMKRVLEQDTPLP